MDRGSDKNVDADVARGFGKEWSTFRQDETSLAREQRETIFQNYFQIFPWQLLPAGGGIGADVGCGTGRWATMVAPRVSHLHLVDVSPEALAVARENLQGQDNVSFHVSSVADIPLPAHSLDFAFSLGVLHHVPDTQAAISAIAAKLKQKAPVPGLSLLRIRQSARVVQGIVDGQQQHPNLSYRDFRMVCAKSSVRLSPQRSTGL